MEKEKKTIIISHNGAQESQNKNETKKLLNVVDNKEEKKKFKMRKQCDYFVVYIW